MRQRLGKSYPVQLEAIPALLVLLGFYLAVSNYTTLPDRIPTHFDFRGVADEWGGRGSIWVSPAIGAGAYLMFTAIVLAFAAVADPMKLINLPQKRKAALTLAQAEELRVFCIRSLFVMKIAMTCLTTFLTYDTIQLGLGRTHTLGGLFYVFLAAILLSAFAMTWKAIRLLASGPRPGR